MFEIAESTTAGGETPQPIGQRRVRFGRRERHELIRELVHCGRMG